MCVLCAASVSLLTLRQTCAQEPSADGTDAAHASYEERVEGLERLEGFFDVLLDRNKGAVLLELPAPDEHGLVAEFLYVESLVTGLGSNPVGLDRGQLGRTRVVRFRQIGPRLLLEQPNLGHRALSDTPAEQRAVEESFARSVLWAGKIEATAPDGRLLVDVTSLLLSDAHNVAQQLKRAGQGVFTLDRDRSAVELDHCLAFPDNVVLDASLTFASSEPGPLVRSVAPTAEAVTLTQRLTFVRLPDADYQPRAFDPRMASFPVTFMDFAAPLTEPIDTRWIARHRLEKTDPQAARSPVKKPIVYYVDPGAPEPVRSALVEGARWWARAFEEAGFVDAFRVEVAPPDMHPLDVRYNYIQWVHRSTRGWSYGGSIVDPRTGEIIKGHVSLGSLRVRQDLRIFQGLLGADGTGKGGPDDPLELALARIRQLAAHEVGHTLGFAHNFAASTYDNGASVMDYPAPHIRVQRSGALDTSEAYGVGVGSWDVLAVRYAYSQFPPGVDEEEALASIVREAIERDMLFLTDADARPAGAAHPLANLWDNGEDPVSELENVLRVRQAALSRFGQRNLPDDAPLALLQETLAPIYLYHRYQLQAAVKAVGGVMYRYKVKGDGQPPATPVAAQTQRQALQLALRCLEPATLDLPDRVLELLHPQPFGYSPNRELFPSRTSPAFDFFSAVAVAADLALDGLLQPERANRLVEQHSRDAAQLGLEETLQRLIAAVFDAPAQESNRRQAIRRQVQDALVARLIHLALDSRSAETTAAIVDDALAAVAGLLENQTDSDLPVVRAHARRLLAEINRHLDRPAAPAAAPPPPPEAPPGQPIGVFGPFCEDDWFAPSAGR